MRKSAGGKFTYDRLNDERLRFASSNTAPSVVSTQCTAPCTGNSSETCGGNYALTIAYNATLAAAQAAAVNAAANYQPFGCYKDDFPTMRVLGNSSTTSSTMTPLGCAQFCQAAGYSIAGVEYSREWYVTVLTPELSETLTEAKLLWQCHPIRRKLVRSVCDVF